MAAAIAPWLSLLMVFRVCQAIGAAVIVPNGFALLGQVLPENRRGSGFGPVGAEIAISAAVGPPLGRLLGVPTVVMGLRWLLSLHIPGANQMPVAILLPTPDAQGE